MNQVTVKVPATTANLGVGFDCLGTALTLYNEFQFTTTEANDKLQITVLGAEADKLSRDDSNLIYRSVVKFYQHIQQTPPNIKVAINLNVPLARGLGSSATAIIGGLLGGNYLAGSPLSQSAIMELAIAIEGHPDNVVPALLGNCQLSVGEGAKRQIVPIAWHPDLVPVVAIPNFELSTAAARSVLPSAISLSDAIFNISRMGLLLKALESNDSQWLSIALEDKLHQPYRQQLIQGYEQVKSAAIAAGAHGMVISGAGPTLLALTNIERANFVIEAMKNTWAVLGVEADVRSLSIDLEGATISG